MHEESLLRALLADVDEMRRACLEEGQFDGYINEIYLEVGPLAGVEPALLQSAFERIAPGTVASRAELILDEVPLEATCLECDETFEVKRFTFRCPHCKSERVQVVRGDACLLTSIGINHLEPPV